MADVPSWLREDDSNNTTQNKSFLGSSSSSSNTQIPISNQSNNNNNNNNSEYGMTPLPVDLRKYKNLIYWGMKIIILLLCLLMITTAIIGFTYVNGINETGQVMVAFYMILFAGILAIFELIQIYPSETIDLIYRRNFGFLYGTKGKALFIVFIAFLSFGITEPASLCLLTGFLVAAFGAFKLGLFLKYPELFEDSI